MSDKLPVDSYAQRMRDQESADSDTGLDFGQALAAMKAGKRVRRAESPAWIMRLGKDGAIRSDGIFISFPQCDLLAEDWEIVEESRP